MRQPQDHPVGWRFVLKTSEDWIKKSEDWPANVQKRKKDEETQKKEREEEHQVGKNDRTIDEQQQPQEEHAWKRDPNVEQNTKHNDAYATNDDAEPDGRQKSNNENDRADQDEPEEQKLRQKYSPQEIALLRSLQHEKNYIKRLKQNDGKRSSPALNAEDLLSIDEADQFSPDNWIPRSSNLIRLTGKHPLNAEPKLLPLFDSGLITPSHYHYVRNHGYAYAVECRVSKVLTTFQRRTPSPMGDPYPRCREWKTQAFYGSAQRGF